MAPKKIFKAKKYLRHYKVIALALGAPGVGAGGPEMLAQLGTSRS